MAVMKACPRCRKLIPQGLPYCATCAPIAAAEREAKQERRREYLQKKYNRAYNQRRRQDDPKYRQFRNTKEWKQTSRSKLQAANWKCEARLEGCQGIASEVHHIKPLKTEEGWALRLTWSNLQAVCIACHNKLDKKGFKKKKDPNVIDIKAIMADMVEKMTE